MLREERSERLGCILDIFGEPREVLLMGGQAAWFALEELWRSYIDGNFLAVMLLSHVFAEQSLGGSLILAGTDRKISEGGLKKIADELRSSGQIDDTAFALLDELRRMRIAYTHPHEGLPERSHMKRILNSKLGPFELLESDAKMCLTIVADVFGLRRQPMS